VPAAIVGEKGPRSLVKGFDERIQYAEDTDLNVRVAQHSPRFLRIEEPGGEVVIREERLSRRRGGRSRDLLLVAQKWAALRGPDLRLPARRYAALAAVAAYGAGNGEVHVPSRDSAVGLGGYDSRRLGRGYGLVGRTLGRSAAEAYSRWASRLRGRVVDSR
jgi:hypothetical protein